MVELALSLGASRVEIAHVQYYGWALKNRAALMPSREQVEQAVRQVETLREPSTTARSSSMLWCRIITRVFPNPASAVGAAARSMSRRPAGCFRVMPPKSFPVLNSGMCASIRSPTSGALRRHFCAFRGTDWMQEPCQIVRTARSGFWRMPLPGLSPYGRCPRCRSGLSPVAAACACRASWRRRAKMPPTLSSVLTARRLAGFRDCNNGEAERWMTFAAKAGALRGRISPCDVTNSVKVVSSVGREFA